MSLKNSILIRNIAKLLSGRVAAAVISVLFIPVIARLYGPADFGLATVFVSVVSIAIPLTTLCYEMAIVLPKHNHEANNLIAISFYTLFGSVVVIGLLFFLKDSFLSYEWLETPIDEWLWLVPIAMLFVGAGNILESVSIRYNQFTKIGVSEVSQATMMPITRIIWAVVNGSTVFGMVIGYIAGSFARVITLYKRLPEEVKIFNKEEPSTRLISIAKSYRDFPFYNLPSRFLRLFSNNLPIVFFGAMFAPELVGFYAMALRLIQGPTEAVSNVIRKVFLKSLSDKVNNQDKGTFKYLFKMALGMFLIGFLPYSVFYLFSSEIIVFLLGLDWVDSVQYIEILIPWFFVIWISMPLTAVYVVYRRQRLWMYLQVFSTFVRVFSFAYIYYQGLAIVDALTVFVFVAVATQVVIILSSFAVLKSDVAVENA